MKKQDLILVHYSSTENSLNLNQQNIPVTIECGIVTIYNIFQYRPNSSGGVEIIYTSPIYETEEKSKVEEPSNKEFTFSFPTFEEILQKKKDLGWDKIQDFFTQKIEEEKNRQMKQAVHKTIETGEKLFHEFKEKSENFTTNLKGTAEKFNNSRGLKENLKNLFSEFKKNAKDE